MIHSAYICVFKGIVLRLEKVGKLCLKCTECRLQIYKAFGKIKKCVGKRSVITGGPGRDLEEK